MAKGYLDNPDGTPSAPHLALLEKTRAANRIGTVEDVADFALLLVSEKSRWITGQYFSANGGITIN